MRERRPDETGRFLLGEYCHILPSAPVIFARLPCLSSLEENVEN